MSEPLFDLGELASARQTVARTMAPTPQLCWPLLCEAVGTEVWVKHENHTPRARTASRIRSAGSLRREQALSVACTP